MMKSLELRIPPLFLVAIAALIMWLISLATPGLSLVPGIKNALTVVSASTGFLFCLYGVLHFRKAKTTVNPLNPSSATTLVSTGIYRISRNPMYVGFLVLLLSWAIFLANPYTLIVVILYVPYLNRFQILPEEKALHTLFGDDYVNYTSRVRRWL